MKHIKHLFGTIVEFIGAEDEPNAIDVMDITNVRDISKIFVKDKEGNFKKDDDGNLVTPHGDFRNISYGSFVVNVKASYDDITETRKWITESEYNKLHPNPIDVTNMHTGKLADETQDEKGFFVDPKTGRV